MDITKDLIEQTVSKIKVDLDKLITTWYVGGSAGLLLLGYELDRPINDIDIIICAPKPSEENYETDWTNPRHIGTQIHQALVGPNWKYTKSGSHCESGMRIVHGKRDGVPVDIIIKIQDYPTDILQDILYYKARVLSNLGGRNYGKSKHQDDLNYLYDKYGLIAKLY